uniref:DUF4200 domain-containing protein n=1 Tax=Caenorhabditis tropicalis TaxID=1561998 RepID=A0A1I7TTM5_9PELO
MDSQIMNAEKEVKEEVDSEDEMPQKRSGVKRKRESTSNENRSFESSSLLEKVYEELLDSKKCCRALEERILNMEKELLESKERNEILEARMKNMEEIRSLEERHIPITETISAACYYLEKSSKIIDLYNEKNEEIEKKLVEIQNKLMEHVELNREEMKEIWVQIGVNYDEQMKDIDERIQKKFKEHVEQGELEKLEIQNKIFDIRKEFQEHVESNKENLEKLELQKSIISEEQIENFQKSLLNKIQENQTEFLDHVDWNQDEFDELRLEMKRNIDAQIQKNAESEAAMEKRIQTQLGGFFNEIEVIKGNLGYLTATVPNIIHQFNEKTQEFFIQMNLMSNNLGGQIQSVRDGSKNERRRITNQLTKETKERQTMLTESLKYRQEIDELKEKIEKLSETVVKNTQDSSEKNQLQESTFPSPFPSYLSVVLSPSNLSRQLTPPSPYTKSPSASSPNLLSSPVFLSSESP